MALYEVYQMVGTIAVSVEVTQSMAEAEQITNNLQARGVEAFWEQIQ